MRIVPLSVRIGAPAAGTVSLRAGLRVGAATRIIHGIDGLRIGLPLQQPLVTRGTRRAILYRRAGLAFERMSGAGRKKNPKRHDIKDHSHGVPPFAGLSGPTEHRRLSLSSIARFCRGKRLIRPPNCRRARRRAVSGLWPGGRSA